jgi:hypothetical protein
MILRWHLQKLLHLGRDNVFHEYSSVSGIVQQRRSFDGTPSAVRTFFAGAYDETAMRSRGWNWLTVRERSRLTMLLLLLFAMGLLFTALPVEDSVSDGLPLSAAAVPSLMAALRRGRGRPRKFTAPSRAVTLTLPEAVIARLSRLHHDLSRAVVGLTQRQAPRNERSPAELVVFGKRAVISIRSTPSLEKRAGVQLVPLPDGRALISFDAPKTIAELELTINDALEDPRLSGADREVYDGIRKILKDARQSRDVTLARRSIIVLESTGDGSGHK